MSAVFGSSVAALLGPTNTGKTHRAIARMLEHRTGMIGLPLRLLAREVYDRVSSIVGELEVALVTGEEKRVPPRPRYWIATVEAMPLDLEVDFLAVDEIQLCAHPQRGHVFTDRLLHARGRSETWFLGSDTMRDALVDLVPVAEHRRHPRFSRLTARGAVNLASLPPRSALIAFSAREVYELADRLRGRRGGAAVVLGALSPRTRNAQVAMYQAGEVDYLVATDAIGMGLNLDLDHVAFASLTRFDGRHARPLAPTEVGQIAGRAGRHVRDGSFGTLAPLELGADVVFAVENHRFPAIRRLVWRNSALDFASLASLQASLDERPRSRWLSLVEHAEDAAALKALTQHAEVRPLLGDPELLRLAWAVCEIPDFRRLLPEHHASLLAEIFLALVAGGGRLSDDGMERHVRRLETAEGDIDTLIMRLELVRTWRYVANRGSWLDHPERWQRRTEQAEDAISDALHQRLIERFVDRAQRRRRAHRPASRGVETRPQVIEAARAASGPFAMLAQLRGAVPSHALEGDDAELGRWVDAVVAAPFEALVVDEAGAISFDGERVAELVRGRELVHPEVKLALGREVPQGRALLLLRRLRAHARDLVTSLLAPLDPERPAPVDAATRGLLHQLSRGLGTLALADARPVLEQLSDEARGRLLERGVTIGRRAVYVPALADARAVRTRLALVGAFVAWRPPVRLEGGAVAVRRDAKVASSTYLACGYLELGPLAMRVDAVEALLEELDGLVPAGPIRGGAELAASLGRSEDEVASVLLALGFTETEDGFVAPARARAHPRARPARRA